MVPEAMVPERTAPRRRVALCRRLLFPLSLTALVVAGASCSPPQEPAAAGGSPDAAAPPSHSEGTPSAEPAPAAAATEIVAPEAPFGLANGSRPEPDLLASGQPTAEQLAELAAAGYRTVVDLRAAGEPRDFDEPQAAADLGLSYVSVPVTPDGLDAATFETFFAELAAAERPALVHCATSNRAGALYYAYLVAEEGVDRDSALARARTAGLRSDALIEKANAYLDSRATAGGQG